MSKTVNRRKVNAQSAVPLEHFACYHIVFMSLHIVMYLRVFMILAMDTVCFSKQH